MVSLIQSQALGQSRGRQEFKIVCHETNDSMEAHRALNEIGLRGALTKNVSVVVEVTKGAIKRLNTV